MTSPDPLPLVIGITGKRDLKGKEAAVRAALAGVCASLDRLYPQAPKIMLTALAIGADQLAAALAEDRPGWSVVAPLPFAIDEYAKDFADGGAALRAFARRTRVIELPVLRPVGHGVVDLADKRERSLHYEQVGLFISDHCSLLLVVKRAGEQPGDLGGTARIARYRSTGDCYDEEMESVFRRSKVLREPPHLAQPLMTIDLTTIDTTPWIPSPEILRSIEPRPSP